MRIFSVVLGLAGLALTSGSAFAADTAWISTVTGFWSDNAATIWSVLASLVLVANAITAATATKSDNRWWGYVLAVLNFLALNFGKNTNADAVATIGNAYAANAALNKGNGEDAGSSPAV
ncbi:hypothetical protein C8N35_10173 [Breoghania corrubedonensis]|uniref:TrbC/VIRB2 family protein n=1 Tax=Breoghania corrubedonensis TaxID=665038 RepID=A0A2T5VE58_9HYPH|nr:hypothetical protein [Breoghania corrubedonensis]PTW62040.1 hypothetical protein C8N35_10173 [Breoghania corrubedonensis]